MNINLKIDGMACASCENAVHKVLSTAPSVVAATVERTEGRAFVETSEDIDPQSLISALTDAGYDASVEA